MKVRTLDELIGKTFDGVAIMRENKRLLFMDSKGKNYEFLHDQECCEDVYIESIVGDLTDLIDSPILKAEEVTHEQDKNPEGVRVPVYQESFTWTFYKFATIKGYVDVRWYGVSNGYYSESVTLRIV